MDNFNNIADEVRKHADIVKVISSYLPLVKRGKNYLAVCPFHDDSNPSLTISPEKQIFKCFVCGTSGDAIGFVKQYEKISFMEAVKKVAELSDYHIEGLDKFIAAKPKDEKKDVLLRCLKDLSTFYCYQLSTEEGKDGLAYFEKRHLDALMRNKYRLGFAPKDAKTSIEFLKQKGYSLKNIEDIGIATANGNNVNDLNHGRAIFPIADADGNVVGFSARQLVKKENEPKYVNSPETYVFHKSSILYNYHIAKDAVRLSKFVYICEGFMDVFALAKIGIDACVATMGTSLSSEHIEMLRKLNCEIRVCLDGDAPGQTAALKVVQALDKAGLTVTVVDTKGNLKDPDEILNEDGPDALKEYLGNLTNRLDFVLNYYLRSSALKDNDSKRKLIAGFVPIIINMKSSLEADTYVRKLAKITGYDIESIRTVIEKAKNVEITNIKDVMAEFHPERKALRKLELAEREVLYQMLSNKDAVAFYERNIKNFYDDVYRQVASFVIEYASEHDDMDANGIVVSIEMSNLENKDELVKQLTTLVFEKNHPQKCDNELLDSLLKTIDSEKNRIYQDDVMQQSIANKDPLEQARILSEYNKRRCKKKE